MKLFKKTEPTKVQGTLTDHIATYLDGRQRKLAVWLNQKTQGISKKSMLCFLILFCSLVGSYLLYILSQAFN